MTHRMLSARHRRTLALAALTVGLHVLALRTIVLQDGVVGPAIKPPPLTTVRLLAAPSAATAVVAAMAVAPPPLLPPPPLPLPGDMALPAIALATTSAIAPAPQAAAAAAPALAALPVETGAAVRLTDVESIGVKVAPAAPASAALTGKAYRTDVPPSARIVLDVARKDADGTLWHGEAAMAWQLADGHYRLKLEAGIRVLVARVNLVVLESSGQIDGAGFVPRTMTEQRRGRAVTATRFDQGDSKITFSASPLTYAVAPGTQDKATISLQLAAIARADSEQLNGPIDILVGEDRDASVFRFVLVGQEEIETPIGRLHTWHLSRPPRFGAYNARFDVWLAPSLGWLPVRIDNIESSGATTSQTVKQISRPDAG